ncbi:MAG: cytochrome c oxidase subunit II [Pseudomonadota bacterium]
MNAALAAQPAAKALGFQDAASPIMHEITSFHNYILLPIITAVVLFVLGLLVWCMVRYNSKSNPTPSKNSHNTLIEVLWTVVPILILIFIAIPSFRLLYNEYSPPPADLTVKATGYSWYWNYTYPDQGGFAFDSRMLEDKDRKDPVAQPRLLAVDNELVVPVNKVVVVQVTADPMGVIHAFALPAFGVKVDAVPGRLNEVWFKAERTGIYYGQCSELCGANHSFMPISIRVVEQAEFDAWLAEAKQKYADNTAPELTTAALK